MTSVRDDPFADTNIFLRHLLADDPVQSPASQAIFVAIERGDVSAWTTDLAIAEVVFVATNPRRYNVSRAEIARLLLLVISLPGLHLPNKRLYPRIFELYTTYPIDYIDAYHAALVESRGGQVVYSYDRDFDRIPGLRRIEPA